MIKYAVLFLVLLSFTVGSVPVGAVVDSINYKIEIGDISGAPGTIVKLPVKLKNIDAVGGLLIRIEYDQNVLSPVVIDDSDPGLYFDSLEVVGRGLNTEYDSGGNTAFAILAYHRLGIPEDTNVIFVRYIQPIGERDNFIDVELGDPSIICYMLFRIEPSNTSGIVSDLYVKNYDGPGSSLPDVEIADTTGFESIVPGLGPVFDSASLTVGQGVCGDFDHNGVVNMLDLIYMLKFLYMGGPEPTCP